MTTDWFMQKIKESLVEVTIWVIEFNNELECRKVIIVANGICNLLDYIYVIGHMISASNFS